MLKKTQILTMAFIAISVFSISSCETMEGAGRDIEHAGESVQDAAE
jgi:predicted small secreted protein